MRRIVATALLLFAAAQSWAAVTMSIEPNGWVADVYITELGTGGTYAYGLGSSNSLTGTEKLRVALTSPGFDDTGAASSLARTVVGTMRLRLPYPNQTTAYEVPTANGVMLRVALSDYVHATDTVTGATLGAGFYAQGGSNSPATTLTTMTNLSASVVPRVIAQWSQPGYWLVGSNYDLSLVAFHYSAQQGRPVRAVQFWAVDSAGNRTPTNTVTVPTVQTNLPDAVPVVEYVTTMNGSGLAQGSTISNYARVLPWYGPALDFSDGVNPPGRADYGPYVTYGNRLGTWPSVYAVVDPAGTTAGVAVTNLVSATNGTAIPFGTIADAMNACGATNNARFGSNTLEHCTVLLTNGSYAVFGGNVTTRNRGKPWTTLAARPDVNWSNCLLTSVSGNSMQKDLRFRANHVVCAVSAFDNTFGNGYGDTLIDSCLVLTNRSGAALVSSCTNTWARWTTLVGQRTMMPPSGNQACSTLQMRGCTMTSFDTGGGHTTPMAPALFIGNAILPTDLPEQYAFVNDAVVRIDPVIWAFNRMMRADSTVYECSLGLNATITNGVVFAQNVIEVAKDGNGISLDVMFSQSDNEACTNFLVWNNTILGKYHMPFDYGYVNPSSDHYQEINNLQASREVQLDVGRATASATNRWALLMSVGDVNNVSSQFGIGYGQGATAYANPAGKELGFDGLASAYNSQTNTAWFGFLTNGTCFGGNSNGLGNYLLSSNSPVISSSLTGPMVLAYDIRGLARATNDPAGAYGYYVGTPPETNATPGNWYVAKEATGANNGTSWANAWTNVTGIAWASLQAGDTIWLSGGTTGSTNIYQGTLSDQSQGGPDATRTNPITIKAARDSSHNGLVLINGGVFLGKKYYTLDGSKSDWTPDTVLDTYNIGTNINIEVRQTNATSAVQIFGTGSKVRWVHVSQMTSYDDSAFSVGTSAGSPVGDGSEIAYCRTSEINGYGIRAEMAYFYADTYGQLALHHNLIERTSDNFIQASSHVDIYKNVGRFQRFPTAGHPDVIQEVDSFSRIWNNVFSDNQGYGVYVEANSVLTHDLLVYNNVFSATTNGLGGVFDFTGHDNEAGQACNISNVWIFNNTVYNYGSRAQTATVLTWNRGNYTNRPSGWVSNFWFLNNAIIGVAPYNNTPMIQLFTNEVTWNGITGFTYSTNDVRVDYNSVTMATNTGLGILYGARGNPVVPLAPYTNMAQFAAETQYKSNNNATASFVSLPAQDYRIAPGDTALVWRATNLVAMLTNIAPEVAKDIRGMDRGAVWDIGAYQHESTYYVSTNGSDSGSGSVTAPWRTIQKAANTMIYGDTVLVSPGDYDEYVSTTAHGSNNARITFRAYPANDPLNPVITRQFRVKHQCVTIEGFRLSKAVGASGAMVRIEGPSASYNGSDCWVTNNTICDGVMLLTRSASFGTNYVHIRDAYEGTDFRTAGFTNGATVFLGADSLNAYTNCGSTPTVLSNSADGLTMYFTTALTNDLGTNYWSAILAGGDGPTSWKGIQTIPNGGYPGASNIMIMGNTFSNLIGVAIMMPAGSGTNRIVGNKFTRLHAGNVFRLYAANTEVAYNTMIDSTNIIWFAGNELSDPDIHPAGGKYYDFQCTLVDSGGTDGQTNVNFHHNWVQNFENEFGSISYEPNAGNYRISYCVFIGVLAAASGTMNNLTYDHCTFYRNCYEQYAAATLYFGTHPVDGQSLLTNLTVSANVFVDNGGHYNLSQEAPYSVLNATNAVLTNNYSVFAETMGWTNTPASTGTFGSGDPLFVNARNPLGPDGLPFTDDDGLRPLPNSTLAVMAIGALAPLPSTAPIAHFTALLPVPGWKDATGTNFNTAYAALKPHQRTGVMRPWNTPEALDAGSMTVTFDASKSIDGFGTNNTGITSYGWQFSDGVLTNTSQPTVSHTFTLIGTNTVTLTVTNSAGAYSSYQNSYRALTGAIAPAIGGVSVQRMSIGQLILLQ